MRGPKMEISRLEILDSKEIFDLEFRVDFGRIGRTMVPR